MKQTYEEYPYASSGNPAGKNAEELKREILVSIRKAGSINTICELGCGNGWLAHQLAQAGYRVTAIDGSDSGIGHAKGSYGGRVVFLKDQIDAGLAERHVLQGFDLVLASEVIEHLYRPSDLLSAAYPLLREKGYLMITTPYHGYLKNVVVSLLNRADRHYNPLWDGGHIKFFSPKTLTTLLTKKNFKVIGFKFVGRLPFLAKSMICVAQKLG